LPASWPNDLMQSRVFPVFCAFFVMGFVDAVGSLVGFVSDNFALSGFMAGLLPSTSFLAFGLFSVPAGLIASRKGKKFVLLFSLAMVFVGQVIALLSGASYAALLGALFVIGVGMALNGILNIASSGGRCNLVR
jgi:FHS family L-fucose permease-like MFS transporter